MVSRTALLRAGLAARRRLVSLKRREARRSPARRNDDTRPSGWRSERGTVIVMVAVSLLALLAFSAFSVDHGVLMTGRAQAQNAADAGAMAAALYLAWDDSTDLDGARQAGIAAAQQNMVFGGTPDVTMADVSFPTCPPGGAWPCRPMCTGGCVSERASQR